MDSNEFTQKKLKMFWSYHYKNILGKTFRKTGGFLLNNFGYIPEVWAPAILMSQSRPYISQIMLTKNIFCERL